VDAGWGGDVGDRKSTTGFVIYLNKNPISWKSRKQNTVALSTCEAEYMALADVVSEIISIRSLLTELGFDPTPTSVFEDNQGTIALATNPVNHSRAKHIDIKFHFIRDHIANGTIMLEYIPTHEQVADIMTKGLSADKIRQFLKALKLAVDDGSWKVAGRTEH
jgi:hypothetical protein